MPTASRSESSVQKMAIKYPFTRTIDDALGLNRKKYGELSGLKPSELKHRVPTAQLFSTITYDGVSHDYLGIHLLLALLKEVDPEKYIESICMGQIASDLRDYIIKIEGQEPPHKRKLFLTLQQKIALPIGAALHDIGDICPKLVTKHEKPAYSKYVHPALGIILLDQVLSAYDNNYYSPLHRTGIPDLIKSAIAFHHIESHEQVPHIVNEYFGGLYNLAPTVFNPAFRIMAFVTSFLDHYYKACHPKHNRGASVDHEISAHNDRIFAFEKEIRLLAGLDASFAKFTSGIEFPQSLEESLYDHVSLWLIERAEYYQELIAKIDSETSKDLQF